MEDRKSRNLDQEGLPAWIKVQEMSWKERAEIHFYKVVSLIPVSCTVFLYIHLFVYYSCVSDTPE